MKAWLRDSWRLSRGRAIRLSPATQARLNSLHAQLLAQWRGYTPRERSLLIVCVVTVVTVACWMLLISPPLAALSHWKTELPRLRSQQAALEAVLADKPPASFKASDTLAGRLDEKTIRNNLDATPLAGAYMLAAAVPPVQGQDATAWQITVEDVDATALMDWLLRGLPQTGGKITQLRIEQPDPNDDTQDLSLPAPPAGRVNATLTLGAAMTPAPADTSNQEPTR
ncbi:General secretion pathway%2C M protein [Bordetella ansorpii]|uniref:General secretion pathway, M protein n=1 Tax=Bordetella ansorpii TaxID=288768 RepID=A0A157QNP4_9BORD|nr:type II secretion system protein GspM [Bordetella ansorpii]SAI47250.1 General secretion pathway%2C M protein [Bordetella ansorpii]